jgi:phosphopentomutase
MPTKFDRICLMVMDSAGIGEMPDAAEWGDAGADTLGHIMESRTVRLTEPAENGPWQHPSAARSP